MRKFADPDLTASGETRAWVDFRALKTLWFNTGSLCNIACANCYIESSPKADHFSYLTPDDVAPFLDELADGPPVEIGFTGGEPFLNPDIIRLCEMALERGHRLLVLTNAMRPMMRPRVQEGLLDLRDRFGDCLTIRVSLDHHAAEMHDRERGAGAWERAMPGLDWLSANGFALAIAGREELGAERSHYAELIARRGWNIDAADPSRLVLFAEMTGRDDVPEITTACWDILGKRPDDMMCASSRMVVRRRGEDRPAVLACTLLWDDTQFEMGRTLGESLGAVKLNHSHCATFCVLGGSSCS